MSEKEASLQLIKFLNDNSTMEKPQSSHIALQLHTEPTVAALVIDIGAKARNTL